MNIQLPLTINDRLLFKIEETAKQMQIDKNDLIIKALKKYLLIYSIKSIRKRLKPLLKKQGFKTEEDIFNAVS